MVDAVTRTAAACWADAKVLTRLKGCTTAPVTPSLAHPTVVLNLWVSTSDCTVHGGCTSGILHIRYLHYESLQEQNYSYEAATK